MKSTDAPSKQAVPFGTNGPREAITATTPSGSNQASYDQGFPPITMTLKSAGGLPPKGQDMNQILFEQSSFNRYFSAGGGYVYDSTFSTAVGGYPLSARIPNSTGTGFWFNTVEDNQTNPENSTSALTGWIPMGSYGVTAMTGLTSASVTLTTLQASKDRITLSGTLTANINLVVPAWRKSWTVVNNCTGAFSVTVKTPSGTGVAIPAGNTAYVLGDGTNITQDVNVLGNTGKLLGAPKIFTSSGTYTPTTGTSFVIVETVGAGGGAQFVPNQGSTNNASSGGGGGGSYALSYFSSGFSGVTITVGTAGAGGIASSSTAATAGGASSFGSLVISPGGSASSALSIGTSATGFSQPGAGGVYPTGTFLYASRGSHGSVGLILSQSLAGGIGGVSGKGSAGGVPAGSGSSGGTASGYGGGGGGTAAGSAVTGQNGGAGAPGTVIVWEYA